MPTEGQMDAWFPYIFGLVVVWNLGFIGFGALRRLQAGEPIFPKRPDGAVFYQSGASGRSLGNLLQRFGGASRCLVVIVANNQVKTDLTFPFNLFFAFNFYDIRIDVRLSEIRRIERRHRLLMGETVRVFWSDERGYEFTVRDPDALVRALNPAGRIAVTDER